MSIIANTPKPPYYAVIFTSTRTQGDFGYDQVANRMVELAEGQPGFWVLSRLGMMGHKA